MTIELYRCSKCGEVSTSLGYLHAHIESHRGYFGFLQIPFTKTAVGNSDELMKYTEVVEVDYDDLLAGPDGETRSSEFEYFTFYED